MSETQIVNEMGMNFFVLLANCEWAGH